MLIVLWVALGVSGCTDQLAEARGLERNGDVAAAVEVYKAILSNDPGNEEALRGLAASLWVAQRYNEALPYQEKLVRIDPREVQVRVELGFNYLNHQGRPREAAARLREAADLDPTGKHWVFAGQALAEAGETAQAEAAYRRAIAVDPTYGRAYDALAGLLDRQGRTGEAQAVRARRPTGGS